MNLGLVIAIVGPVRFRISEFFFKRREQKVAFEQQLNTLIVVHRQPSVSFPALGVVLAFGFRKAFPPSNLQIRGLGLAL